MSEEFRGVDVVTLIKIELCIGKGVEGDPVRLLQRYYDTDGEFLFEIDEWQMKQQREASRRQ